MIYRRFLNVPTWGFRSPMDELQRMRQQLEQMFEGSAALPQRTTAGVFPLINLTEDKDSFFVRAELPGVKSEELDIQVTANNLSISGERKIVAEEGVRYHRKEREAGRFSRVIGLPGDIDADRVDAKLENGVLKVVVPKAEAAKPKQITVNS